MSPPTNGRIVIAGAGPAGLTAALELVRHGRDPIVLESAELVGGIARTESHKGFRFDIGGHRFFTKVPEIEALWHDVMAAEMLRVPRLSRIFHRGHFLRYPLAISDVLRALGPIESALLFASYVKARLRPTPREDSFEEWVVNRFGRRLYETFFRDYTEKVWGIPCTKIRAEWAAQRIQGLSLWSAVKHAVLGQSGVKSLIGEFSYPRLGPGQMWEAFARSVQEQGGEVRLRNRVARVFHRDGAVREIDVESPAGTERIPAAALVSSMPIGLLVEQLDPPPPPEVLASARALRHRDFLVVTILVNRAELFPDQWIYVHSSDVRVGRIQNFGNWSRDLVPQAGVTSLGMEYFCSRGDELWEMDDAALTALAAREVEALGLARAAEVTDGCVIRQEMAYPVYDEDYRRHLDILRVYLDSFSNLQTIGRNGMHRYNNQDHSMLCGLYAARNLMGASHDLWEVNTERSYYEEQVLPKAAAESAQPLAESVEA